LPPILLRASAAPYARRTLARLIFLRMIVYQRSLIPLVFPVWEIRDIKTIKAVGKDGID
jgi:hypothetical protein